MGSMRGKADNPHIDSRWFLSMLGNILPAETVEWTLSTD